MIDTSVNLNNKSIEEFEELLTKINQEFGFRELALKLRERQVNEQNYNYGEIWGEERINNDCLNTVHELIIKYVNN